MNAPQNSHTPFAIRPYAASDQDAVVALWQRCGLTRPWNNPVRDIERKSQVQAELFLVATRGHALVGSAMFGYDGHRGWVNYLAVDPAQQRQGCARDLMDAGVARLKALGCPKLNLQVREDNLSALAFYERLGYRTDAVVSLGLRLIEDTEASALATTPPTLTPTLTPPTQEHADGI